MGIAGGRDTCIVNCLGVVIAARQESFVTDLIALPHCFRKRRRNLCAEIPSH